MFTNPRKRKLNEQVVPCPPSTSARHLASTSTPGLRHTTSSSAAQHRRSSADAASAAASTAAGTAAAPPSPFCDVNYPIPDFENVYAEMRHPDTGLALADRRWRFLTYSKCFVGSEAVQWLCKHLSCDPAKAVATGQRLMDAGIIHHVTHSEPFADNYFFYRFQEDDDTNILNMKRVWDPSIPTRDAVEVAKDLITRLALLCEEHRKHILATNPQSSANPPTPTFRTINNNLTKGSSTPSPSTPIMSDPTLKKMPSTPTPSPMILATPPLSRNPNSPDIQATFWAASGSDDVDYSTLAKSERFRQYTLSAAELQRVSLVGLNQDERIALFVNIYNTLVLHAYVVYGAPNNLLRRYTFFRALRYRVAGLDLTLDDIEHGILRGNKRPPMIKFIQQLRPSDPKCQHVITNRDGRIHFVISAGTRSDPPIRILDGDNVQEELHYAAVEFLSITVKLDVEKRIVCLPRIFYWYQDDFPTPMKQLLLWVARYLPVLQCKALEALVSGEDTPLPTLTYENFDWSNAEARFNASVVRRKRRKLERERNSLQDSHGLTGKSDAIDPLMPMSNVPQLPLGINANGVGTHDTIEGLFAPPQTSVGAHAPIISPRAFAAPVTAIMATTQEQGPRQDGAGRETNREGASLVRRTMSRTSEAGSHSPQRHEIVTTLPVNPGTEASAVSVLAQREKHGGLIQDSEGSVRASTASP